MARSKVAVEWLKILSWLGEEYRCHLTFISQPGSISTIESVELELGYMLPEGLKSIHLLNDGESSESQGLFGGWRLLSLTEQRDTQVQFLQEYGQEGRVYHPVMESGGGDYYCIDLESGRIIEYSHEIGPDEVVSNSLEEFLSNFNKDIRLGKYKPMRGMNALFHESEF